MSCGVLPPGHMCACVCVCLILTGSPLDTTLHNMQAMLNFIKGTSCGVIACKLD